jgi:hypothetical protein
MKWIEKTLEGQTLLEEEISNIRKVETQYEGNSLKTVEFADKRGTKILRFTGGDYGSSVKIWVPEEAAKKE